VYDDSGFLAVPAGYKNPSFLVRRGHESLIGYLEYVNNWTRRTMEINIK